MFSKFWALDSSVWCVAPSMIALAGLQGGYRVMIVSVVHLFSPYVSPSLANQYSLEKGRVRLVCLCSNKLARNSLLELLKPVQVSLPRSFGVGGAAGLLGALPALPVLHHPQQVHHHLLLARAGSRAFTPLQKMAHKKWLGFGLGFTNL